MMKPDVEFEDYPDSTPPLQALKCPHCGAFQDMHHDVVVDYSREGGEDGPTVATIVGAQVRVLRLAGNPSERRDGVCVQFDCMCCSERSELCLAQHKGETHVFWRKA